jgi:hypothetical protein
MLASEWQNCCCTVEYSRGEEARTSLFGACTDDKVEVNVARERLVCGKGPLRTAVENMVKVRLCRYRRAFYCLDSLLLVKYLINVRLRLIPRIYLRSEMHQYATST